MVSSVSPSPVLPDFESHDEHEVQNNSSDSPEACFTRLSLRATAHPSVDLGGAMAYLSKRQTFVRNAQRGDIKEPVLYDSVIDHVIRIMCKSEYEAKRKIGLVLTNFAEEFYDWNEAFEGATQISRDSMHMLASTHEYKVEGFNTNVNPSFSERSATWSPFGLPTVMSYLLMLRSRDSAKLLG